MIEHAALARACYLKFMNQSKDRMWLDQALPLAKQAVGSPMAAHGTAAAVDRVALFRSISLFEGFAAGDLLELANSATERSFRAGQVIFQQGDRGTQMYVIAMMKMTATAFARSTETRAPTKAPAITRQTSKAESTRKRIPR